MINFNDFKNLILYFMAFYGFMSIIQYFFSDYKTILIITFVLGMFVFIVGLNKIYDEIKARGEERTIKLAKAYHNSKGKTTLRKIRVL